MTTKTIIKTLIASGLLTLAAAGVARADIAPPPNKGGCSVSSPGAASSTAVEVGLPILGAAAALFVARRRSR
jgi:MYXO-CTERM domain-containing protein